MSDGMVYNDPAGGTPSSMGTQFNTSFYDKKSLQEVKKEQFFGQLADVTNMPKNMGKKIKKYHYLPLLDDANINDQGIDANGAVIANELTIIVRGQDAEENAGLGRAAYFVGSGADAAAALLAAQTAVNVWASKPVAAGGLGLTLVGGDEPTKYTDAVNSSDGLAYVLGYRFSGDSAGDAVVASGNLYGSSKDVGTISGKLPALSESGGRVNRVGFKRIELEGSIEKFGFFDEYTKESMDFDTDAGLEMHVRRELVLGASEVTEDALQVDLLNSAGVIRFGGEATIAAEVSGEGTVSEVNYNDLMRLSIDLDNNRCPKQTKMITGSRMIDTKVVEGARFIYIGSELIPTIKKMVDNFSNQAFISVASYASAGTVAVGEIGMIDQFKIIVVPEMMFWAGEGAAVGTNPGYRETGGNYDVYPMLVVGDGSFTTIGFQTDGKTVKFKIKHVKPESDNSYSKDDPFGEKGFTSIKWYYGFLLQRSERIALIKTVAEF